MATWKAVAQPLHTKYYGEENLCPITNRMTILHARRCYDAALPLQKLSTNVQNLRCTPLGHIIRAQIGTIPTISTSTSSIQWTCSSDLKDDMCRKSDYIQNFSKLNPQKNSAPFQERKRRHAHFLFQYDILFFCGSSFEKSDYILYVQFHFKYLDLKNGSPNYWRKPQRLAKHRFRRICFQRYFNLQFDLQSLLDNNRE